MPLSQSKTLEEALQLTRATNFDYALLLRILREIDVRLKPLQDQKADVDAAIDAIEQVGLDRINEVLTPAIQAVLTIQERGFLIADSPTSNTLGVGNVLTFNIPDEDERAVFTPSKFVFLSRIDNTDDWGIARLYSYDKITGTLIATVTAYQGDEGPHDDWQISAVAGSTIAQMALLELAEAAFADTDSARDQAVTKAGEAAASAASALASKNTAIDAKDEAAASAVTATGMAGIATTKAAEAAASAASIAGGPVASVDGKTGIVVTDPTRVTAVVATLDLDFTSRFGFPASPFVRATPGGYRQNSKGLLVPTTTNEPVIDFSAGTALGTGFYGAYTNLALRSEEFDNASWAKSEATITANATASPDGSTTADKLVEAATTAIHFMQQGATISSGATVTISWHLKAGERSALQVRLSGTGGTANVGVNLATGVLTTPTSTGPFSGPAASIEALPGGWYRVSLSAVTTGITFVNFPLIMGAISADNYLGDGASGLYAWGAQFTATAFPVPYVPTTSATVARNGDGFGITGADFAEFYNPREGTVYLEGDIPGESSGVQNLLNISDNTSNNAIILRQGAVIAGVDLYVISGGVSSVDTNSATIRQGNSFKIAANFSSSGAGLYYNGAVIVGVDPSVTMPTVDRLAINSLGGLRLKRLIYWPKALTATELQRMTA